MSKQNSKIKHKYYHTNEKWIEISSYFKFNCLFFIIKGFQTIVFIFFVISTMVQPICPQAILIVFIPYLSYIWFTWFKSYKQYLLHHFWRWSYIFVWGYIYIYIYIYAMKNCGVPTTCITKVSDYPPTHTVHLHCKSALVPQVWKLHKRAHLIFLPYPAHMKNTAEGKDFSLKTK